MAANTTNVTPSNRRQSNLGMNASNSKNNILTSKAMAYLNSKKANSFLKNYEEALHNTTKFIQSQGRSAKRIENNSSAALVDRGRSQQKSRMRHNNQTELIKADNA